MPRSQKFHFAPNVPVQLVLKRDGVPSSNGRVRYELVDDRHMLLNLDVAERLTDLEVNLGEPFWACLKWTGLPEEEPYFDLWLDPAIEKKRAREEESDLERQLRESLALRNPSLNPNSGTPSTAGTTREQLLGGVRGDQQGDNSVPKKGPVIAVEPAVGLLDFGELLLHQTKVLVDGYAAVLKYSSESHGAFVTPEAIRSFVITAYIAQTQGRRGFRNQKDNAA
jgi:hypothetical protein